MKFIVISQISRISSHSVRRLVIGSLLALALMLIPSLPSATAQNPSPTPLQISIPTRTITPEPLLTVTPTRTPTVGLSAIKVEAKSEANIRTAPDLSAQIIAKVGPGKFYTVVGRRAKWIQILYQGAPGGRAWVFEDVVNISGGDPSTIPELDVEAVPTANLETAAAQQTAQFLTATPGAPGTATAARAAATGVFTIVAANSPAPGVPLPTFTFPPPRIEATLPARANLSTGGGMPPIFPILGLAALGILGLLASLLRR